MIFFDYFFLFFCFSYFVFFKKKKGKKGIQVWNYIRMSKYDFVYPCNRKKCFVLGDMRQSTINDIIVSFR